MIHLDQRLIDEANRQPYPNLFVTLSGAHLYGFPSSDSDYDLRGVHVLPIDEVIGLDVGRETIQVSEVCNGLEFDLVTHEIKKFFGLLLKNNGYVLEQLYSPLIVLSSPEHDELKAIGKGCITRHHAHHYLGFANTEWRLFEKESLHRVKPLLYVYRVLLTGIHLMQTGEIQANLGTLNEKFQLPYIPELIERKLSGAERSTITDANLVFYRQEFERLVQELEKACEKSGLPEAPSSRNALNDLLIRVRWSRNHNVLTKI